MKKVKRARAMAGVVVLAGMYGITLIAAVMATPVAKDFFKASLLATLMVPILIYVYLLVYRLITGKGQEKEESPEKKR